MGLGVYLNEIRIGELARSHGNGCEFAYASDLTAETSPASKSSPLSLSLPIRPEPYGPEETRPFLDGLLPEGERRDAVAEALGLDSDDTYGLLAELGRDCPGAVVFVPEGEEPPGVEKPTPPRSLTEEDFASFVDEETPLLPDPDDAHRMRFALPGDRPIIALVKDGEGWAWPTAAVPSTHVLITEVGEMPQYATNLMACTSALRKIGLPAAQSELVKVGGMRCLLTKRFDRWSEGAKVDRVHRETFNQALGVPPDDEEALSTSYESSLALLQKMGDDDAIEALFAFALCNYLLGNDDSVHGRRAAIHYPADGPMLSPFCPVASDGAYVRPTCKEDERSVAMAMVNAEDLPTLLPGLVGCDPELMPVVAGALVKAAGLSRAVRQVGQEARADGWYLRVVDKIPPYNIPYSFYAALEDFFDL